MSLSFSGRTSARDSWTQPGIRDWLTTGSKGKRFSLLSLGVSGLSLSGDSRKPLVAPLEETEWISVEKIGAFGPKIDQRGSSILKKLTGQLRGK